MKKALLAGAALLVMAAAPFVIPNVTIQSGTIDNATIGSTTPAAGHFTTLSASTPLPITSGGTGASTAATVRTNLGLGALATLGAGTGLSSDGTNLSVSYGTAAGTAAQGNDSRITGALQSANNLSDIGNAATALGNLAGAPLASPTFTGTPRAPNAGQAASTTQIATTQWVQGFLGGANLSGAQSGYQILPNGAVIEWGQATSTSDGSASVTFPSTFPNGMGAVSVIPIGATSASSICVASGNPTRTAVKFWVSNCASTALNAVSLMWIAVGW